MKSAQTERWKKVSDSMHLWPGPDGGLNASMRVVFYGHDSERKVTRNGDGRQ